MKNTKYIPWLILFVAVCAWAFVAFFAWSISATKEAHASEKLDAEQQSIKSESIVRIHALARDTVEERATLNSLANLDVISIVDAIEAAGNAAHVEVEIGQALADSPGADKTNARSVNIVVEAQGSFNALMNTAALLYVLPVPSEVTQLQIERLPDSSGTRKWRLVARILVLTTANI